MRVKRTVGGRIASLSALILSFMLIIGAIWFLRVVVRFVYYMNAAEAGEIEGDISDLLGDELAAWVEEVRGTTRSEEITNVSEAELLNEHSDPLDMPDAIDVTTMVKISVGSANIRSGPGTNNGVITVVNEGQEFYTTGNVLPADDGTLWYELYIDDTRQTTGWASEKVIELIE